MGIYPELNNLSLDELLSRLRGAPPDGPGYADAFYLEVADVIAQHGRSGANALRAMIPVADAKRLRAILYGLATSENDGADVRHLLGSYLTDRRSLVAAEAIDGLTRLGAREYADRVLKLRDHASPYVRAAVLRFVRRVGLEGAKPLLIAALGDQHPVVRSSAIDELDALGDADLLPLLRTMTADEHPNVRDAACMAIENLESLNDAQAAIVD
ncbi:MAG: HEAT repeat domain-containing protein [Vicinamibacterales bacterium]